jgi:CMP/dCMP kinase
VNLHDPETGRFAIAIDGPAASGKSTLARELAKRLGLVMVNSGAMYRAVTWKTLQENLQPEDSPKVVTLLRKMNITCGSDGIESTIAIDGQLLNEELRSEKVNANVSTIAAIPEVREKLVGLQRDYLQHSSLIMEGRDIGSVVFPDTPFKIYVTAAENIRAARRVKIGEIDAIAKRDAADSARATAPLIVPEGAVILDTSDHTIESGLSAALDILKQQGLAL